MKMTHVERLVIAFHNHTYKNVETFEEFLIKESELNHNKSIVMSGDIGQAFSKIGELEGQNTIMKAKIKDLNKALEVMQLDNENK